jgi:endonuclease I
MSEYKICEICVKNIRKKLLELKSVCFNKVSYETIKKNYLDNYIYPYDIYLNNKIDDIKMKIETKIINFEHIIPTTIYASERPTNSSYDHNVEPFFDPHIIYPTLKKINDFRSNCTYNDIFDEFETLTVSEVTFKKTSHSLQCDFQPNDISKHCIARCLFYAHLMYFSEDTTLFCTDVNKNWKKFFLDNIMTYHNWCNEKPISDNEHKHNKSIILEYGIPNVFIGYFDYNNGKVKYTSFDNLRGV